MRFRVLGLNEGDLRRWRRATEPNSQMLQLFGWAAAILVVVYTVSRPGRIEIVSPPSGTTTSDDIATVTGIVENALFDDVVLRGPGSSLVVPVRDGRFSTQVPLLIGENRIQVAARGLVTNLARCARVIVYSFDPGEIEITSPENRTTTNRKTIVISGRVKNTAVPTIALRTLETVQIVPVRDGIFETPVQLRSGANTIAASVGDTSASIVVYTVANPGEIALRTSASGATSSRVLQAEGTVENPNVSTITIDVNGRSRVVSVDERGFAARVSLTPGENIIRAFVGDHSADPVTVTASIPPTDIWTELTWDGPADIDLHLYLPNDEHCFYSQPTTQSGAVLDVDNTVRDGPEHITMKNAIPGRYRVTVLYYAATDEPPRPVHWQVRLRLRNGDFEETYRKTLFRLKDEQEVHSFEFP